MVCGLPERFLRTGARSHVYVKMRAVDARRFVREFKKEYGDRIEGAWKKWNRSILCIEPITELAGKRVVSS